MFKLSVTPKEINKIKNTIALCSMLTLLLLSCQNKDAKTNNKSVKKATSDSINSIYKENDVTDFEEESSVIYPKAGFKSTDFLPKSGEYKIQYEAEGDLNRDGLDDKAIVLNTNDKTAERPMLILLQNNDKSFRLDKISNVAMPAEYNDSDFKLYDTEDISIEKGLLKIQLYGSGPSGNLFSDYKYFKDELVLIFIETYNVGAGSWQQLYYNLQNGKLIQEITNTIEESMPVKTKTYKLRIAKYIFENASSNDIIEEAYKNIDSDW